MSKRNKHERGAMRREDFFGGIKCSSVQRGRRYCDGWMCVQLASYYPHGPVFEEMCCLKCNKVHRVKMVKKGRPRERAPFSKDFD